MSQSRLLQALRDRPLVLDAAMGTRLLNQGLDLARDDPCLWNLAKPELVQALHRRDLLAGADAVLTNTFGANRPWLARFGRSADDERINHRAVVLAREAAGLDRFILGNLGPTGLENPADYLRQAEILANAGVDALILETHAIGQALGGLGLLRGQLSLPIFVSLFLDPDAQAPGDDLLRLQDLGADVLGVNCVGPASARRLIGELVRVGEAIPWLVLPSALPEDDPFAWRAELGLAPGATQEDRLSDRVRLIGGCCGTDDRHVGLLRETVNRLTEI